MMLGQHILLDLYGCPAWILRDERVLQDVLTQAAQAANAQIIFQHFHHFGGKSGVTGVLLLAESHISIHTWTEHAFAAADIFVCGNRANAELASRVLIDGLKAQSFDLTKQNRGFRLLEHRAKRQTYTPLSCGRG